MRLLLRALAVVLLALPVHAAEPVRGMVRYVYDGDTLLLVARPQGQLKVRLYGIDAPETARPDRPGQPYGAVARRVLMYKLLGRVVTVEPIEQDKYGRLVGVVRLDGRDIDAEMVAEGLAWAYREYLRAPYAATYLALEGNARRRRLGLWRQEHPRPPWVFRHSMPSRGGRR